MYALRIYKSNVNQTKHTNTVVGIFEAKNDNVHMFRYTKDADIDWSLCKLRIWPANDKKHTIYPLPPDMKLFLFSFPPGEDEPTLLSSVFEADDYISFEPVIDGEDVFYLVVAADKDEAQIKLSIV